MLNSLNPWMPFGRALRSLLDDDWSIPQRKWYAQDGTNALHTHWDEQDDKYVITSEIPGVEKEDVKLTYENNYVSISADYGDDEKACKCGCMRQGKYSFIGYFPSVDTSTIVADLKNGILTVTLPKAEEAKAKEIPIQINS